MVGPGLKQHIYQGSKPSTVTKMLIHMQCLRFLSHLRGRILGRNWEPLELSSLLFTVTSTDGIYSPSPPPTP
jgi:hypothetical protein